MNVNQARDIADRFLEKQKAIALGDSKIEIAAFAVTDVDHDAQISEQELVDALVAGRIMPKEGRLVPANQLHGLGAAAPKNGQAGLAPTSWIQGVFQPGGNPANPPQPMDVSGSLGSAPIKSQYNGDEIKALSGKSWKVVSGKLKTPADVAFFLGKNVPYDSHRFKTQQGGFSAYSSDELLQKMTGICRDQHAFARDVLIKNGYKAELIGYAASEQSHAVTVYQDKKTGLWGVLEYGQLYPPELVKGRTPEEALMIVRPNALAITHFANHGPHKRSEIDGIIYTPASRVMEQFMSGPALGTGNGVSFSSTGVATQIATQDGRWQAGMKVITDPGLPYLRGSAMFGVWHNFVKQGVRIGAGGGYVPNNAHLSIGQNIPTTKPMAFGFVSVEEFHPRMLEATNIAGSGVNVTVGSHSTVQTLIGTSGMDSKQAVSPDIVGTGMGLSSIKANPTVTVDKAFNVWGNGSAPDTKVSATYGAGIDVGLAGVYYATGGTGVPISQYVTGLIETGPVPGYKASLQGYVPITNYSNDFAPEPLARAEVTTPVGTIGTTQGASQATYDVAAGVQKGNVRADINAALVHDRKTGVVDKRVGVQAALTSIEPALKDPNRDVEKPVKKPEY